MNNKTNIEEDIEKLKEEIARINKINDLTGTYVPVSILENILADRERLIEENNMWKGYKKKLDDLNMEDWVSKNEIRDKIEALQKEYENIIKKIDLKEVASVDIKIYKAIKTECQRSILKELLENK